MTWRSRFNLRRAQSTLTCMRVRKLAVLLEKLRLSPPNLNPLGRQGPAETRLFLMKVRSVNHVLLASRAEPAAGTVVEGEAVAGAAGL
ncbi:hypothetical protein C1I98_21630 [Spongiactinospora gelatinilytica]|uniref:Uncharacterized protein n=1 Tax=Spongiactinospora gelatinilytica TaxID=2666298 RepID=A0A2W2FUS8_9ACTN|nr:hypothetical protein C1I98_21630 [Spongiactinospora gelatinilytica]